MSLRDYCYANSAVAASAEKGSLRDDSFIRGEPPGPPGSPENSGRGQAVKWCEEAVRALTCVLLKLPRAGLGLNDE